MHSPPRPAPHPHTFPLASSGNTTALCAPGAFNATAGGTTPSYPVYDTHGVAVQYIDNTTPTCNVAAPECTDYDTGNKTCCTSHCEVLGTEFFQFSVAATPDGFGVDVIELLHTGMPPDASDPYNCPIGANGLARERQLAIKITCSEADGPALKNIKFTEVSLCSYLITATSSVACGTTLPDDCFSDPSDSPSVTAAVTPSSVSTRSPSRTAGTTRTPTVTPSAPAPLIVTVSSSSSSSNFGFTALGVALCVVGQVGWSFADKKGYTQKLRGMLSRGGGGSARGYNVVSKVGTGAATAPVTEGVGSPWSGSGAGGYGT